MIRAAVVLATLCILAGCKTLELSTEHFDMLSSSATAVSKASRPISDEEEYYVGRAVAARILATYPLRQDSRLFGYINRVGQVVALNSEKPFTYTGYHFAVLDSAEVNAFACPGGMIFVTSGMLADLRNEEELAAVLAHEVAHINHRDGIEAISKSRWTEALAIIGTGAAKTYGPGEVAQLVSIFEGSIDDVFKTLVVKGYGRSQEYGADQGALLYLERAGYDPRGMETYLSRLKKAHKGSDGGMFATHPATGDRLENVQKNLPELKIDASKVQLRSQRFVDALGRQ
jgi:predicted Zn-dependent protease